MPSKQSDILMVYQTQFFAKIIQAKLTAFKNIYWALKAKELNAMPALFEVHSVVGTLSFGK